MRTKEDILKDLGVNSEYSAHGGIPADTKDVILAEILIDIRDQIFQTQCMLDNLLDPVLRAALKKAGLLNI